MTNNVPAPYKLDSFLKKVWRFLNGHYILKLIKGKLHHPGMQPPAKKTL
jgi:hypothetical protein